MNLSAAQKVVNRALWEKSPVRYELDRLRIRDEHGKLIQLVDNQHQLAMDEIISTQTRLGHPRRMVVLKERKAGISTKSLALIFHAVEFTPADALIVAHDSDFDRIPVLDPQEVLRPAPRFREKAHRSLQPEGVGVYQWRQDSGSHRRHQDFWSFLYPLYLLCSEAAYYPDPETVMVSLLNSVPDTPESMVIVESTANGAANWFHKFYWDAVEGRNIYKAQFLCWKDLPKHALKVDHPKQFEASLSPEERKLQSKHTLSLTQLNWRRYAIANKCDNDPQKFCQEYPLTDREAFLVSGRGRFDREAVMGWNVTQALHGYLEEIDHQVVFLADKDGPLRIWQRPLSGRKYVLGADGAEGIEIEGAPSSDRYDHSSAHVMDRHTGEVVAHLHGDFEPREFGRQLALAGKWYNYAFAGVEANNNGLAVLDSLENCRYPASAIYARTFADDNETARYGTPQRGWKTTIITRANMVNHLATAIRFREFICPCAETQGEVLKFVIKASGRVEHDVGAKDDRVFSLGICLEMVAVAPEATTEEQTEDLEKYRPVVYRAEKYARLRQATQTY